MRTVELESGLVVKVRGYEQPHIVVAVARGDFLREDGTDDSVVALLPLGPSDDPLVVKSYFRIDYKSGAADAYKFRDGRVVRCVYANPHALELSDGGR